jgi:hypothetical protein
MRIGMMSIKEFYSVKTTFVDIKMDVSCFKIWRAGFSDFGFRVQPLDLLPCGKTDSFTVCFGRNKKQNQLI